MKTILVTGSTGFLGRHLVERLKQSDPAARLRLLCRDGHAWPVSGGGVEVVPGDVTSAEDVLRAAEGAKEIYHLAGIVDREGKNYWRQYTTHVEGTRNVCEAIRRHGVGKAVHVSSSGTIAVSREPEFHEETAAYKNEIVAEWPYYLSKIYAEKLALRYVREEQLPLVVVNPSLLLGPGDDRLSSTRDMALFLDGQIPVIPTGGLNLVDARDAAAGLVAAMEHGRPGERYLLGGVNLTFHEWMRIVAKVSGVPAPRFMVPPPLSLVGARVLRKVLPIAGRKFELDDASVKMSALFWYCNSSKARRELGFETRDAAETIRDTVSYLRRRRAQAQV
jgi:dihydroflavonol-4-reductase